MVGKVVAVCISAKKGEPKRDVGEAMAIEGFGLQGDAHAGGWHRQVSLLALEDIELMRSKGFKVGPGDFAENVTVEGLDLSALKPGMRVTIGRVELEVTQIGKECHSGCAVFKLTGDCIMPRKGIFARVLKGGMIRKGDAVLVQTDQC
ncbi:MAG: MOSC domain-containing protein [Bacillota bacterium]